MRGLKDKVAIITGGLGDLGYASAVVLAEEFAKGDPYVLNGLVARWTVREWSTAVGELSANPVYPADV